MMIPIAAGLDLFATVGTSFGSSTAMTASTHKTAFVGTIPRTGTITSVGFRFGAVTRGATTALTVSLQDVDLSNGPPGRPDGTPDQTGSVATGSITANSWISVSLGTSRSVTVGQLIAVVIEYSTFLAGDSMAISQITSVINWGSSHPVTFDGTTWTRHDAAPNLILGYSSGNNGALLGAGAASAIAVPSFNSNSTPDERGGAWVPSVSTRVAGLACVVTPTADFDLVLYDSVGTALGTASFDANTLRVNTSRPHSRLFSSPVDVVAGATYYLAVKPTSASNITLTTYSVNSAIDRDAWPLGTDLTGATRTNAGSWSTSTTDIVPIVPILDQQPGVAIPVVRAI